MGMSNIGLFFNTAKNKKEFAEVLAEIQEYIASKYSTLITDNPEEQRQQITAYIAKYLNDYSLGVEGMSNEKLIDGLYTEMAEFSFLTKYLFATDVEEVNINSWKGFVVCGCGWTCFEKPLIPRDYDSGQERPTELQD